MYFYSLFFKLETAIFVASIAIVPAQALEFPSFDGSNNNLVNLDWGKVHTPLIRLAPPAYEDGYSTPRSLASDGVTTLPNPRDISNVVVRQDGQSLPNSLNISNWLFQWGQFVDHDISLNEPEFGAPPSNIPVNPIDIATGKPDTLYSPFGIPFTRNEIVPGTAIPGVPAEHHNRITAYIDASMVYGSSVSISNQLRTFTDGLLKTNIINGEELLPKASEVNVPIANPLGIERDQLFAAGDVRVNEQLGLIATHTLMVREHNRLARELKNRLDAGDSELIKALRDSGLSEDEFLFQGARKVVAAQIQIITYNEFLPLLIPDDALGEYTGYNPQVNASVSEEFANAAFRFGHTTLSPTLLRVDHNNQIIALLALNESFFNTQEIIDNGVDSLLMGLASQTSQAFDPFLVDELRNFMFPAASGGNDLASVNIARGRDVGLGSLNYLRSHLGLTPYDSFTEINPDLLISERLSRIYLSVNDIDLWVGGLAENPYQSNVILGETFATIVADQFQRLRDGDRFFYLNHLDTLTFLEPQITNTTLADLVIRNSTIEDIQDNVFFYNTSTVPEPSTVIFLVGFGMIFFTRYPQKF